MAQVSELRWVILNFSLPLRVAKVAVWITGSIMGLIRPRCGERTGSTLTMIVALLGWSHTMVREHGRIARMHLGLLDMGNWKVSALLTAIILVATWVNFQVWFLVRNAP
jgi:hypothetical protein